MKEIYGLKEGGIIYFFGAKNDLFLFVSFYIIASF
jgi:hypothetical protein